MSSYDDKDTVNTDSPLAFLIDDFSRQDGLSRLGTTWQGFTDRVMGGRSVMEAGRVPDKPGNTFMLRMQGDVSLANHGGFIQVRLPLSPDGRVFDGSTYRGLSLEVRGKPGKYALHLRTTANRAPWSYYEAAFPVTEAWSRVSLPFEAFHGSTVFTNHVNPALLLTLALFAGGKAFQADLSTRWVGFS